MSQDSIHLLIGDDQRFKDRAERTLAIHLIDPQALNSYSYVNNNPLKYTDPDGELIPLVLLVYFGVQAGLTAWDAHAAYDTFRDPNADFGTKIASLGLVGAGIIDPVGGGYGGMQRGMQRAASVRPLVSHGGKSVPLYRGGFDLTARPFDIRVHPETGEVLPLRGPSLNINFNDPNIMKYGGPYRIDSLPEGLKIINPTNKAGHYEIVPEKPMPMERFNELLNQVKRTKVDS